MEQFVKREIKRGGYIKLEPTKPRINRPITDEEQLRRFRQQGLSPLGLPIETPIVEQPPIKVEQKGGRGIPRPEEEGIRVFPTKELLDATVSEG